MATFNLIRNSRVWFTTNVDATTGLIPTSGATISNTNTFELQVLDGFSFSQGTQQTTVQLTEAGNTPVRGQRAFNTSLDPVDFSFSTYIRPFGSATVSCEEEVLWNALLSAATMDKTGTSVPTVSSFTRATTVTNVVTFTCAAMNFTAAGISSGDVVTVSTITGTQGDQWNAPATLTITAGTGTAATGVSLAYLTAPSAAAGTAPSVAPTSIKVHKGAWTTHAATTGISAQTLAHTGNSNKNQLQKFGLYFLVDGILYAVDNAALDQASIDFGLDGIATVAWTGKATALRQLPSTAVVSSANPGVFSGAGNATGTAAAKNTAANYITNKLSTLTLISGINGQGGTSYSVPITGGSITYANNINYVVPANLGVVNTAIGYFTGTRSITGSVTAYLRTGTTATAGLLSDILAGTATTSETKFRLQVEIGGTSNAIKVEVDLKGCVLQVPTIETADVMSTTINFTAQGYDPILANNTYDLANANDMTIKYYSA